jgi:hypothetical protein
MSYIGIIATSTGGSGLRSTAIIRVVVFSVNFVSPQIGQTSAGTFLIIAMPSVERGRASVINFSSQAVPHVVHTTQAVIVHPPATAVSADAAPIVLDGSEHFTRKNTGIVAIQTKSRTVAISSYAVKGRVCV